MANFFGGSSQVFPFVNRILTLDGAGLLPLPVKPGLVAVAGRLEPEQFLLC